jgi:hypothetical protein
MEVHAHSHTERKKWTHYLWEFLMLFLAVFCGFLAENIREHSVEKHREKEYMKEIVENLKYDIIRYEKNLATNYEAFKGYDSLRAALQKTITGTTNTNELYYLALKYAGNFGEAVVNTSTITELKNSGSLRLIEKSIVNEMADYYQRKIYAANSNLPTNAQKDDLQKAGNSFFNLVGLDDYIESFNDIKETNFDNNYNYQNILNRKPELKLLNDDPKELSKYYTLVSQFEIQIKKYTFWLSLNKKTAEKLIAGIQKEYHLE